MCALPEKSARFPIDSTQYIHLFPLLLLSLPRLFIYLKRNPWTHFPSSPFQVIIQLSILIAPVVGMLCTWILHSEGRSSLDLPSSTTAMKSSCTSSSTPYSFISPFLCFSPENSSVLPLHLSWIGLNRLPVSVSQAMNIYLFSNVP